VLKRSEFQKGRMAAQMIAVLAAGLILALIMFFITREIGFKMYNTEPDNMQAGISGVPSGDLTGLTFRAGDFEVKADASKLVQEINVPYEATVISVTPQVKDAGATTLRWSVNDSVLILIQPRVPSPYLPLKAGSNTVIIKVRTNGRIVDTYTITVLRADKQ